MLYAILICTDERCAEEFEAWGEPDEFDEMLCESCGCVLCATGFCEVGEPPAVTRLPHRTLNPQLREAA
jgi:hypothetical protein